MLLKKAKLPTESCAELVQQKLNGGHKIRPFPNSVNRLLAVINNSETPVTTFAEIIESDVALSTRVLRMVNSSLYGFDSEVTSVRQAVSILGQRALKNLALTYAGSSIVTGDGKTQKQVEMLWSHSLGCATVARILADEVRSINSDEAFLAGIFHDIGKLFFLDVIPDEYSEVFEEFHGAELSEQEEKLCGLPHTEAGLQLTVTWPLSDEVKGVIRYHHEPEADTSNREFTTLIYKANTISRLFGIGSPPIEMDVIPENIYQYLELDEEQVASLVEEAKNSFAETKQVFSK